MWRATEARAGTGMATAALWLALEEHKRTGKKVFCRYHIGGDECTYLTAEGSVERLLTLNEGEERI